jgi:hypothetical protein
MLRFKNREKLTIVVAVVPFHVVAGLVGLLVAKVPGLPVVLVMVRARVEVPLLVEEALVVELLVGGPRLGIVPEDVVGLGPARAQGLGLPVERVVVSAAVAAGRAQRAVLLHLRTLAAASGRAHAAPAAAPAATCCLPLVAASWKSNASNARSL